MSDHQGPRGGDIGQRPADRLGDEPNIFHVYENEESHLHRLHSCLCDPEGFAFDGEFWRRCDPDAAECHLVFHKRFSAGIEEILNELGGG